MNPKIPAKQRDGLRDLSIKVKKPITELVEMAITRVLEGETTLPTIDKVDLVGISVYLPYEKETALKQLSKETGIAVEDIFRVAIRELLASAQVLVDKAQELALVQEAQLKRKESLLGRDEALMARREALMTAEEGKKGRRGAVEDVRGLEEEDQEEEEDGPGPRAYTRGRKVKHH